MPRIKIDLDFIEGDDPVYVVVGRVKPRRRRPPPRSPSSSTSSSRRRSSRVEVHVIDGGHEPQRKRRPR